MTPLGSGSQSPFLWHVVPFGPISSPERHENVTLSPVTGGFLLSVLLIINREIPSDSLVSNSQVAIKRNNYLQGSSESLSNR
jgi:hypothetical protein